MQLDDETVREKRHVQESEQRSGRADAYRAHRHLDRTLQAPTEGFVNLAPGYGRNLSEVL